MYINQNTEYHLGGVLLLEYQFMNMTLILTEYLEVYFQSVKTFKIIRNYYSNKYILSIANNILLIHFKSIFLFANLIEITY
jgi:hypothetical protein